MPSDVLERRPGVAAAERAMAAVNAQIGVATAAFYPSFVMAPFYGVQRGARRRLARPGARESRHRRLSGELIDYS